VTVSQRVARVALVLAASCGKDTPHPSSNAPPPAPTTAAATERKPCDYVKRADAEKAVGLPLPQTTDDTTLHECRYDTSEFYGSTVTVGPWDQCKTALASSHPATVANLGDEAWFIREHVFIRKGDRCLSVEINGPLPDADKDDGLARVQALAVTILPTF